MALREKRERSGKTHLGEEDRERKDSIDFGRRKVGSQRFYRRRGEKARSKKENTGKTVNQGTI